MSWTKIIFTEKLVFIHYIQIFSLLQLFQILPTFLPTQIYILIFFSLENKQAS